MPCYRKDFLDSRIVDHPVIIVKMKPVRQRIKINNAGEQENYYNWGFGSSQTLSPLVVILKNFILATDPMQQIKSPMFL